MIPLMIGLLQLVPGWQGAVVADLTLGAPK